MTQTKHYIFCLCSVLWSWVNLPDSFAYLRDDSFSIKFKLVSKKLAILGSFPHFFDFPTFFQLPTLCWNSGVIQYYKNNQSSPTGLIRVRSKPVIIHPLQKRSIFNWRNICDHFASMYWRADEWSVPRRYSTINTTFSQLIVLSPFNGFQFGNPNYGLEKMSINHLTPHCTCPDTQSLRQEFAELRHRIDELATRLTEQISSFSIRLETLSDLLQGATKDYYTVDEVASKTGRSTYTVRRWVKEGRIQATRIDGTGPRGRLLISCQELDNLVRSGLGNKLSSIISTDQQNSNTAETSQEQEEQLAQWIALREYLSSVGHERQLTVDLTKR